MYRGYQHTTCGRQQSHASLLLMVVLHSGCRQCRDIDHSLYKHKTACFTQCKLRRLSLQLWSSNLDTTSQCLLTFSLHYILLRAQRYTLKFKSNEQDCSSQMKLAWLVVVCAARKAPLQHIQHLTCTDGLSVMSVQQWPSAT